MTWSQMASYLLDTNHAASLATLSHPLRRRILAELQAGHSFSICTPALAETLFGIGILPRAEQNLAEWARLRPFLPCIRWTKPMPNWRRNSRSHCGGEDGSWKP